jgi:caa(3)-type oxidase subunit IV
MSEPTAKVETAHAHGHEHGAHAGHDDHAHHGSVFQHAKPYIIVGGFLFVFTLITVGLSYVDFARHKAFKAIFGIIGVEGMGINIVIGLFVAAFKVCLVGWYFMHLKQEKRTIWRPLFFTFFFVTGLFLLFLLGYADPIPTTSHPHH